MKALELIGDPVRLRIVRHLSEHERASLPELAEAAGVHVNTARPHVVALEEGELLTSDTRKASGPGRPGVDYMLADGWTLADTNFIGLAELLAVALARLEPDRAALRGIGAEWGRYLLGRPGVHDPEEELPRVLESLGFHSRVEDGHVCLIDCPCRMIAPDRHEMVCALAEGVVEGVYAASGEAVEIGRARPQDGTRVCHAAIIQRRNGHHAVARP
jgi:predicted ArsR family transcriptional regulator